MKGCALIFGKEAAPRVRSGSYADGITDQSLRLPLTVMGPHVNLPSSDHSEVASDKNRFANCFLALCAKTLSEAKIKLDSKKHFEISCNMLESWERLVKSTSSALSQNKMEHLPFFGQTLLTHQLWRASNNFSSLKSATKILIYSGIASLCEQRIAVAPMRTGRVCLRAGSGSVRETLPLPYETRSRGHLVRQTAFSRTESTTFSAPRVPYVASRTENGPLAVPDLSATPFRAKNRPLSVRNESVGYCGTENGPLAVPDLSATPFRAKNRPLSVRNESVGYCGTENSPLLYERAGSGARSWSMAGLRARSWSMAGRARGGGVDYGSAGGERLWMVGCQRRCARAISREC